MSVNRYNKSGTTTTQKLELIASKGNRTFVGTKAAVEAALKAGNIGNASLVYITDDYTENTIPEIIGDNAENVSGDKVAFLDGNGDVAQAKNALTADNLKPTAKLGDKDIATLDSNGYVSKALLAKGLEDNAEMGGKKVATTDGTVENANKLTEKTVPNGTYLSTCREVGVIYYCDKWEDRPEGGFESGTLINYKFLGDYVCQMFFYAGIDTIFIRSCNSDDKRQGWKELTTNDIVYSKTLPFFRVRELGKNDLDEVFETGAFIYGNTEGVAHIPTGTQPQFGALVISIASFNTYQTSSFGSPGIQVYIPAWGMNGAYIPPTQIYMRRSYWTGGGDPDPRVNVKWTQWKQIDFLA